MKESSDKMWEYPAHTAAKHAIFSKYLDAWYPILASSNGRVLVLDGFAGRGTYLDGSPGSPIIALERLLTHNSWPTMAHRDFVFIFIEKDRANADSLEIAIQDFKAQWSQMNGPWPANINCEIRLGTFQEHASEMTSYLEQQGKELAPTFALIDPFGWTGLPMTTIGSLLQYPQCEVFINFMVNFVNRFLEHPDQADNMNELFGLDVTNILRNFSGKDRVAHLRDVYIAQLKQAAGFKYVRWFAMKNSTGNVVYYLIYGTRSPRGVEKMKDAMWKVAPAGDYCFSDRLAGMNVLFEPEPDLAPLRAALLAKYKGQPPVMVNPDLQEWVLLETPYRKPHLTTVLRQLEADPNNPMTVHRPPGKRQYSAGVRVAFH